MLTRTATMDIAGARARPGIDWRVELTHQQIFERYVYAGAITRDAEAVAALFTDDGVYEAPLVPESHPLRGPLVGRDAIRAGVGAYHREPADPGPMDAARPAYVLHDTADPDVFIAEIDVTFPAATMSLVQIFRVREGRIAMLRDYFAA